MHKYTVMTMIMRYQRNIGNLWLEISQFRLVFVVVLFLSGTLSSWPLELYDFQKEPK